MIYPKEFESKIGFDSIRNLLISHCSTRLGKEEVGNMKFSTSYSEVLHLLKSTAEMKRIKEASLPFPTIHTHDVLPYMSEIRAEFSFISAEKLFQLLQVLESFEELRLFFDSNKEEETGGYIFPELRNDLSGLTLFPDIIKIISKSVNKYGEVKDTASPALHDIRLQIKSAQGAMQRAMRRVMDNAVSAGVLENDATPSLRDGHLVIPVSAGLKKQISGIVMDVSASGKTVFIEPAEVVEAGNKIRELEMDEKREISVILKNIADIIRPHADEIALCCRLLGLLDFISAKAEVAIELNASFPHINPTPELEWYHAEHPGLILSLKGSGRNVVPLDIELNREKRILIISGPNAGGKSVCLKTVAIVQYMLQCGMLPTLYDNSRMGIFKKLFIDIGDEQSFENDLSTYSSHLRNMRYFLLHADRNTLLLADEMGSGTEPQIGGAMAQAILSQLGKSDCYGIVTTHFQNLKSFAESEPGFVNGAMLYDRAHLQPTFQLSIGNPGSSFAIDIAHKMGLPKDVIEMAKHIVGEDYVNLDKYLSEIARDRKYWANKRLNIKEKENRLDNLLAKYEDVAGDLNRQRKEILNDARREAKEIVEGVNARIERTILEIRKSQAEKEKTKRLRQELKEYTDEAVSTEQSKKDETPIANLKHKSKKSRKPVKTEEKRPQADLRPLVAGDNVLLDEGSMVGEILNITGKKAEVAFGDLRTIVDLKRLKRTAKSKPSVANARPSFSVSTSAESRDRQLNFKNEIDVRGMRADEALQAVTYFIDDAIQFNASRVRILHGTGHGILKTLIRQQLKSNSAIKNFADEDIRFGGAGITVVDLF